MSPDDRMSRVATASGAPARLLAAGPGHAIWTAPRIFGTTFWGPHEPGSHERFYAEVDRGMAEVEPPFVYFADAHRLRLGDHDWQSIERGFRWMRQNRERLERLTARSLVLAPNGALGWTIAGAQKLMGMRYPTTVATSIDEALWLIDQPDRERLAAWLKALPDVVRARTNDIARLRDLLARTPDTELGAAARGLGLGDRTLQRLLAAHGTSFKEEQKKARATAHGAADHGAGGT